MSVLLNDVVLNASAEILPCFFNRCDLFVINPLMLTHLCWLRRESCVWGRWRISCGESWTSLRRLKPSQSQDDVMLSGLVYQVLSSLISSLIWETKGCDLHGRLMDLMWWDMGGRLGCLLGNERERRKTPTIFAILISTTVFCFNSVFLTIEWEKKMKRAGGRRSNGRVFTYSIHIYSHTQYKGNI